MLLQLNRHQRDFEIELLPEANKHFGEMFSASQTLNRVNLKGELAERVNAYEATLRGMMDKGGYDLQQKEIPGYYVFVSLARFSDHYYTTRKGNVGVIALGDWRKEMSPPTQLEFLIALAIREAVAALVPALHGSIHLGTRGCICDFTYDVGDTRLKVLGGFVCATCRRAMEESGTAQLADSVEFLLGKKWMGETKDPTSPVSICAKLGQHLFVTKVLQPSWWDRFTDALQREAVERMAKIVAVAVLVGAALLFGWVSGNPKLEWSSLLDTIVKRASGGT
jgi:hypothetical protein